MNDSQLRVLVAILLRGQDVSAVTKFPFMADKMPIGTPDQYMGIAQQWLESSYKNYQPPTGIDQQEVDRARAFLATKGYYFISPDDASMPLQPEAGVAQPSSI